MREFLYLFGRFIICAVLIVALSNIINKGGKHES